MDTYNWTSPALVNMVLIKLAPSSIYFRWSVVFVVGLIVVMFVIFLCSGFRSPWSSFALFHYSFSVLVTFV